MKTSGFRALLLCLVTFAGFSCTPEDIPAEELLVGNWILTSKSIDNVPDTLSECALSSGIEFKANQICILNDACALKSINSGWSYRNGMLNISSHLPAAYYIEQLDGSVLRIRRSDITEAGKLQVTVFSYSKSID
jgi:hypothetical protein